MRAKTESTSAAFTLAPSFTYSQRYPDTEERVGSVGLREGEWLKVFEMNQRICDAG